MPELQPRKLFWVSIFPQIYICGMNNLFRVGFNCFTWMCHHQRVLSEFETAIDGCLDTHRQTDRQTDDPLTWHRVADTKNGWHVPWVLQLKETKLLACMTPPCTIRLACGSTLEKDRQTDQFKFNPSSSTLFSDSFYSSAYLTTFLSAKIQ